MPWSNIPPEHTAKAEKIYKRLRAKGMDKNKASAITYTTLQKMGKIKESELHEGVFGMLANSMGKFGALAKRGAGMATAGGFGAKMLTGAKKYGSTIKNFLSTKYNNFKNTTLMKGVKDKIGGMKKNPWLADKMGKLKSSGLFGKFNR